MNEILSRQAEQLFLVALEVQPEKRAALLDESCGDNAALRAEVEALLDAAGRSSDYFEKLPERLGVAGLMAGPGGAPGQQYGQYRLTEPVGSGGMGTVWRATRSDGRFDGEFAVKLLAHGPGSAAAERFAREARYLARLTHPNIARLLDAGVGQNEQPYLVLEFVEGLPIDRYCDEHALGVQARIGLFLAVLDAVAHAHAHLIVHRDIKPSNVQVALDGTVKLLDFGVAKLLTDDVAAGLTRELGAALTPEYAAPEQLDGEPVTTATDVYSLGLLLWLLVTGSNPRETAGPHSLAELRALAQKEPTRLLDAVTGSRSPATLSEVAVRRNASPSEFLKALRSDLDNIVRKALAVDPAERYQSVADFAQDLRRYLRNEPVTAQAQTITYRTRKFVRRHRGGVLVASLISITLLASTGTALWQADRARSETRRAESVTGFVSSIFQGVDPSRLGAAKAVTANEILEQAERRVATELSDQERLQIRLRTLIARSYFGLFEPQRAHDVLAQALAQAEQTGSRDTEHLQSMHLLMAQVLLELGKFDEADVHLAQVFESLGDGSPDAEYVNAKVTQSNISYRRGDFEAAAAAAEEALAAANGIAGIDSALLVKAHTVVGKAAAMLRDAEQSLQHQRRAFELALARFGNDHDHPEVVDAEQNYAASLIDVAKMDEALPHLRRSLQGARTVYGDDSLLAGSYSVRLGLVLLERGELQAAIDHMDTGIRAEDAFEVARTASMAGQRLTLGRAYLAARQASDAVRVIDEAMAIMQGFDTPFMLHIVEADQAFARAAAGGDLSESIAQLEGVIAAQDAGDRRYKTHLPDIYLGIVHLWNGDAGSAVRHLARGAELAREQTRVAHLAEALTFLGFAQLENGSPADAEQALEESMELLQGVHVAPTPARADALLGLGRVALTTGDPDTALPLLLDADRFWGEFDAGNRSAGVTAFWLGEAQVAMNREADARGSFDRAARLLANSNLPSDVVLEQRARER